MSKTPDLTIILISDRWVARGDYAGRDKPRRLGFWTSERESGLGSREALESVLAATGATGRRIWVLDTEIWSQIVSLPAASVAGVRRNELIQALRFEVETLAGISAEDAQLGVVEVTANQRQNPDGQRAYWLNVVPREQLAETVEVARAHGAKTVALAHPMGIAGSKNRRVDWGLEIWGNLVAWISRNRPRKIQSRNTAWIDEFRKRLKETSPDRRPTVVVDREESLENLDLSDGSVEVFRLDRADDLATWMDRVASRAAVRDASTLPLVHLEKRKRAAGRGIVFKLVAAALVAAFCAGHWWWLNNRQQTLIWETEALRQPALAKQKYDAQLAEVLNQRVEVEQEAARMQYQVKRVEFLFKAQTGRLKQLLAMLSEFRTEDMVIQAIEHHAEGLVVRGISLNSYSAPLMANRLREPAIPLGWKIHAATQIGEQKMTNGGPWDFSILFEDIGPGLTPIADSSSTKTASAAGSR